MKEMIIAGVTVIVAVSAARADNVTMDFDCRQAVGYTQKGGNNRASLLNFSSDGREQEFFPAPGLPYLENFPETSHNSARGAISDTIKDILSECSTVPGSDLYLSLTREGKIVIERDGAVLRVINDPAAAKKLHKVLNATRDEVVEAWVEEEGTLEVTADGVLKKICRFLFEKVCQWVSCPYPDQTPENYQDCVQECKIRITPLGCQATQ